MDCFPLGKRVRELQAELEEARDTIRILSKNREADTLTALERAEHELARRYECKICMNALIETVFLPCGHTFACRVCAETCEKCPVCTTLLTGKTQIFMSA